MIRFEPFPVVISGNDRDDLLYELWQLETNELKQLEGTDASQQERLGLLPPRYRTYPEASRPSTEALNKIERRPAVGPAAKQYESDIFEALLRIGKLGTGRQVLAESLGLPEDLYILPVGERDKIFLPGGEFVGKCLAGLSHISMTNPDDKVPPVKVTPHDPAGCHSSKLDNLDATLVHELTHGVRPKATFLGKIKTGDAWENLEEFFAVVVENIFRSERRDLLLRGGHDSSVLPEAQATSAGFMKNATLRGRVEKVLEHEPLARKLARYKDIKFNPFALLARS